MAVTAADAGEGGGIYNDANATLILQDGTTISNNKAIGGNGDVTPTSSTAPTAITAATPSGQRRDRIPPG